MLRLRDKSMFNLAVILCFGYEIIASIINNSIGNHGNKVSELENTCITSNVSSSSNSLGIIYTLERLNLSGKTGPTYSAKVSKKRFGLTSEGIQVLGSAVLTAPILLRLFLCSLIFCLLQILLFSVVYILGYLLGLQV